MTRKKPTLPEGALDGVAALKLGRDGPGQWGDQNPGRTTDEFLAALHGAILHSVFDRGSFDMKQLDHRAGYAYPGVSNKEVAIHASQLLGRKVKDYPLAKLIILDTLLKNAGTEPDAQIDPALLEQLTGPEAEAGAEAGGGGKY